MIRTASLFTLLFTLLFTTLFLSTSTGIAKESLLRGKLSKPLPANLFVELAKLINPSVVNIWVTAKSKGHGSRNPHSGRRSNPHANPHADPHNRGGTGDPFFDLFENFSEPQDLPPGMQMSPQMPSQEALGTGFVIRKDGLIITNAHVIEGAGKIKVQFNKKGGKSYAAKLIGRDLRTDVALLKIIEKGNFPPVKLGSSRKLQVGEWVAAFGNPLGLGHTMTKGIISAMGREISELNRFPFLQTDASINPGNSGGPLVDTDGYVIGVNTAIARGNGIGFAIPIDDVKFIIGKLEKDGRVLRGFIGVNFTELTDSAVKYFKLKSKQGLLVQGVFPDGPAAAAGLKAGDIITRFAGRKIFSSHDLVNAVGNSDIGSLQKISILRKGRKLVKKIRIATHPGDRDQKSRVDIGMSERYEGKKAPHELGFFVKSPSPDLQAELQLENVPSNPVVIRVDSGSPAAGAGVRVGDVITEVNQQKVTTAKDVLRRLKNGPNALTILRGGKPLIVFVEP